MTVPNAPRGPRGMGCSRGFRTRGSPGARQWEASGPFLPGCAGSGSGLRREEGARSLGCPPAPPRRPRPRPAASSAERVRRSADPAPTCHFPSAKLTASGPPGQPPLATPSPTRRMVGEAGLTPLKPAKGAAPTRTLEITASSELWIHELWPTQGLWSAPPAPAVVSVLSDSFLRKG
jgi:hypothetical protein